MKKLLLLLSLTSLTCLAWAQTDSIPERIPKGSGWFGISAGPSSHDLNKGIDSYGFGLDMAVGWKYIAIAGSFNNFYWTETTRQYPLYRSASLKLGYQRQGKRLLWGAHAGPQLLFRGEIGNQYTTYLRGEVSAFAIVRMAKIVGLGILPYATFGPDRNVAGLKLTLCIIDKYQEKHR